MIVVAEPDPEADVRSCRLVVMPHWRREVGDVVRTMEEAGLRRARVPFRARTAALFSDQSGPRPLRRFPLPTGGARRLRLWWNGADEIMTYISVVPRAAQAETHISFFQEVIDALDPTRFDLIRTPYAFSVPAPVPGQALDPLIGFTGEVDISDGCFALAGHGQGAALSDQAWDLARDVVAGRRTLVVTESLIRERPEAAEVHRSLLWAVKNRVRYEIVRKVASEFPGRLVLRGGDWSCLGFEARPTDFRRRARAADYTSHRVSLDLGSKSTMAGLYPRTADILAAGGGLVQFWSGDASDDLRSTLAPRRAASAEGLIALIDHMLSLGPDTLLAANREMYGQYRTFRRDVGVGLTQEIARRCQ